MIELEVVSGIASGSHVKSNAPVITVGRSHDHLLVIPDPYVSRNHGEISLLPEGYQYRDLASTHGTVLLRDEEQHFVKQILLREGDELNIGGTDNRVRVSRIVTDDVSRIEEGVTMLHVNQDRFTLPEVRFANDSKALRMIVQFDSRLDSSHVTTEEQLFRVLLEYLPKVFDHLDYVAVLARTESGPQARDFELLDKTRSVRLSSTVQKLAEREGRGLVYDVQDEHDLVKGETRQPLSESSQVRLPTTLEVTSRSGVCVPIGLANGTEPLFLQFERGKSYGAFEKNDVELASSFVTRVTDRIENIALVRQNQRLNLNASLGVFASMIGHDIKNYLFYSKKLSEVRDDRLGDHPGLAKGIERSRKLAQGMKDMAAPGTTRLTPVDIGPLLESVATEFSSLFGAQCAFSATVASGTPAIVSSEDLLSRVVWNLVMNAYHAMENRPKALTTRPLVELRATGASKGGIQVDIADNAGGIGPKTLEYMQESFELIRRVYREQEDLMTVVNTISDMRGYTNSIGMFFTAVAVNDLQGELSVSTEPGEGSRFTVHIPQRIEALRNLLRF